MPHATKPALPQDMAFMQLALDQARQAALDGEVPVGAVVVKGGQVIGVGRNNPIQATDPSAHAEIIALRAAAAHLGNYRLDGCTLYVTLEPCAMCSGAMLNARIERLVFAAAEPKTGCAGSVIDLFANTSLNHQTAVEGGYCAHESGRLLTDFFEGKRALQREKASPLREDALRTPERCFEVLPDYPWTSRYVSDLPSLAGLRLHYLDEGLSGSPSVHVFLHPVPGWSYSQRIQIQALVEQGCRVVAPDLIGFGRSDKPKREDFHSTAFHVQCVLELIERLTLSDITLVVSHQAHWLVSHLLDATQDRFRGVLVLPQMPAPDSLAKFAELDAPYPDAGHRAALRAAAAQDWQ